jgi:hypothetical protein
MAHLGVVGRLWHRETDASTLEAPAMFDVSARLLLIALWLYGLVFVVERLFAPRFW